MYGFTHNLISIEQNQMAFQGFLVLTSTSTYPIHGIQRSLVGFVIFFLRNWSRSQNPTPSFANLHMFVFIIYFSSHCRWLIKLQFSRFCSMSMFKVPGQMYRIKTRIRHMSLLSVWKSKAENKLLDQNAK